MAISKIMAKSITFMAIFAIIGALGEVSNKSVKTSSSLQSDEKNVTLSGKYIIHLENNEINSSLEIVTKSTAEEFSEFTNLKQNTNADNTTMQSTEHVDGSFKQNYSNEEQSLHRGDTDVFDEYSGLSNNESLLLNQVSRQTKNVSVSEKSENIHISRSTISWLEAFMFLYRNWQWVLFNTLFMVTWIFFAIFALYRLIGLYWCSLIFSRSLYLVLHLLVFTAATFSIVQLLHLSYGNYQGLPLFLTLLLTHTPSPCLALACSIVIRSILAAANLTMYGSYLASLLHMGIFSTIILLLSFVGDVIVGVSHSSIILIIFRVLVNILCVLPCIIFIYKYVKIRSFHKSLQREFVRELKSLVPSQRSDSREDGNDIRSILRSILNRWAQLTVFSASCVIFMVFCNFSLSLFFTISNVSLSLFWVLHSLLFISQIALVISITAGATLTLTNVTRRNILRRYFIITLPRNINNDEPFVQHGNFIYQRVSVNTVGNGDIQHSNNFNKECSENTQNNIFDSFVERPKVSVRRSATFNCPPRAVYMNSPQPYTNPVHHVLSDHLLRTYAIDERDVTGNNISTLQCRNKNYSRAGKDKPHLKPVMDTDEHAYSPGKFPVMGCNGRSRYGSLHSLPNISPRMRTPPVIKQNYTVNESEQQPFNCIPENCNEINDSALGNNVFETIADTNKPGNYVKDIIMENQNLFRSHSLRQNSLRRKIRNRERVAIRTVPSHNNSMNKTSCLPKHNGKVEDFETIKNTHVTPNKYNDNFASSLYPTTLPSSQYNGIEIGNFCDPDNNSEINFGDKIDSNSYESRVLYTGLRTFIGQEKLGYNGINTEHSNMPITAESSSCIAEIAPLSEGDESNHLLMDNEKEKDNINELESFKDTVYFDNDKVVPNSGNIITDEFSAFTLPSQKKASLNRNISSTTFETISIQNDVVLPERTVNKSPINGNNWYGTWAGRKSKRRNVSNIDGSAFQGNLRKLSSSKSSLSNLYDKLKHRKYKSSMTSLSTIDVDDACTKVNEIENELVIVENQDDSEEEMLPKISDTIDLASEILKSSSMLADFLVNKDSVDMETECNFMDEASRENSGLEIKT